MKPRARLAGLLGCLAVVALVALSIEAASPGPRSRPGRSPDASATLPPSVSPVAVVPAPATIGGLSEPLAPEQLRGYVWPLPRGRLTLPFGSTPWGSLAVDGKPFHDGIDIATFCGDRIGAAHAGVVLAAGRHFDSYLGWVGDLGPYFARLDAKKLWSTLPNVVVVDDGNGYRSVYAHFASVAVRAGQHVQAGQLLGLEGRTGHATGCHLHYGLFNPLETATFSESPDLVKTILVPSEEIARIDPLRVLPFRAGIDPESRRPGAGRHES